MMIIIIIIIMYNITRELHVLRQTQRQSTNARNMHAYIPTSLSPSTRPGWCPAVQTGLACRRQRASPAATQELSLLIPTTDTDQTTYSENTGRDTGAISTDTHYRYRSDNLQWKYWPRHRSYLYWYPLQKQIRQSTVKILQQLVLLFLMLLLPLLLTLVQLAHFPQISYRPGALPVTQQTASMHWRYHHHHHHHHHHLIIFVCSEYNISADTRNKW